MRIHPDMDLQLWEDMKMKYGYILCTLNRTPVYSPQDWFDYSLSYNRDFHSLIKDLKDVGVDIQFDEYNGNSVGTLTMFSFDNCFPTFIKRINADLAFIAYKHQLHEGLTYIRSLSLNGYKFKLPNSLESIDYLKLTDYAFPINDISHKTNFYKNNYPFTI